jgi:hypothetical protein
MNPMDRHLASQSELSASSAIPPVPLPRIEGASVAIQPPGDGAGYWAGGPSAQLVDGVYYLAYRVRRPIGSGRGYANVVARSDDGVKFEVIATLNKEDFGSESLERPALVHTPEGKWRLYISCATPGTKHWWVDVLEADHPSEFTAATRRTVLPGDDSEAVKDVVIKFHQGQWHMWATCHPLNDPEATDRMVTKYATSADGLEWNWQGLSMTGRPGHWDSRGARVAAVFLDGPVPVAFYDARATARENYEERTGIAVGTDLSSFTAVSDDVDLQSPWGSGGLRYIDILTLPNGDYRLYYELCRADGAHDLRTEVVAGSAVLGGDLGVVAA